MKSNLNDTLKWVKIYANGYKEPSEMFFRTFSHEQGKDQYYIKSKSMVEKRNF